MKRQQWSEEMFEASPYMQLLGSVKARNPGAPKQGTLSKAIFLKWVIFTSCIIDSRTDEQDNLNNYFAAGEMLHEPVLGDLVSAIYTRLRHWHEKDVTNSAVHMWMALAFFRVKAKSLLHFHLIHLMLQTVNDYSPWKHIKFKYSWQFENC